MATFTPVKRYIGVQVRESNSDLDWHTLNKIEYIATSNPTSGEVTAAQARTKGRVFINGWARYYPAAQFRLCVGDLGPNGCFVPMALSD